MKKLLSFVLFMAVSVSTFAQLLVKSNGEIIGGTEFYYSSFLHYALHAGHSSSGGYNIGVYGVNDNVTSSGMSYGVYGKATGGTTAGGNIGVAGVLGSGDYGAGIVGATYPIMGAYTSGIYAGYFLGDTKVTGSVTATSFLQSSDLRLKENIRPLASRYEGILDKVANMNVIEYSYKKIAPAITSEDSIPAEEAMKRAGIDPEKKHIGLIAQELRELFPTLVEEGQDGYLAVNYVELVPVLIRAIQELKEELDVVKGGDTERKAPAATGVSGVKANGNVLYQNTPNPFKEQTIIRFRLADDVQNASICIFDMTGKQLKKLPISSGMESVSIGGYELGQGMFLYSLVVNGQEIDTKKMIISK